MTAIKENDLKTLREKKQRQRNRDNERIRKELMLLDNILQTGGPTNAKLQVGSASRLEN